MFWLVILGPTLTLIAVALGLRRIERLANYFDAFVACPAVLLTWRSLYCGRRGNNSSFPQGYSFRSKNNTIGIVPADSYLDPDPTNNTVSQLITVQ